MIIELRRATPLDAGTMGEILWHGLQEAGEAEDTSVAEAISYCGEMIERNWVTVARSDAGIMGFLARDGGEICALYTAPQARGRGIGRKLIEDAKSNTSFLYLQAAASNHGARRFYRNAGFKHKNTPPEMCNNEVTGLTYVWQEAEAA